MSGVLSDEPYSLSRVPDAVLAEWQYRACGDFFFLFILHPCLGQIGSCLLSLAIFSVIDFSSPLKSHVCGPGRQQPGLQVLRSDSYRHQRFFQRRFHFLHIFCSCFFTFFCRDIQTIAGVYNVTHLTTGQQQLLCRVRMCRDVPTHCVRPSQPTFRVSPGFTPSARPDRCLPPSPVHGLSHLSAGTKGRIAVIRHPQHSKQTVPFRTSNSR